MLQVKLSSVWLLLLLLVVDEFGEFGLGLAIRSNLIYIPSDWHRLPPRKSVKLSTRRSSKKKASSPLSNLTIIRERDLSGMNQLKMTVLFLYT